MAHSMIRRRQEAARQRIEAFEDTLRRVRGAARQSPDFERALNEAGFGFVGVALREPADWRPRMKTRDAAKLRLAAARHLFARYPVPPHLERIWLDADGLDAEEAALRRRWYIVAAKGGSLHKAEAGEWLSRREVHAFLTPPAGLSFEEAFWVAVAQSYTDDPGQAMRVARSRIADKPRGQHTFWREVARFFCASRAPREEIDDLSDFLAAALARDAGFSLKGRTLGSLRRQMEAWHRDLAAIERIEAMRRRAALRRGEREAQAATWPGSPLPDWEWRPSDKEPQQKSERFVVRQLKAAEDLVAESSAMRHCVSSYAQKCIAGHASIWGLRRVEKGRIERLLTIELDPRNRAVQVRGRANRLATPDERRVLERWARANGVVLV